MATITQHEFQEMLENETLETVRNWRGLADIEILAKESAELDARRARFEAEVKAAGFTVEELLKGLKAPPQGFVRRLSKRRVKYVNPRKPSQTWSGRGRRPAWLAAQLKAGKSLDRFLRT